MQKRFVFVLTAFSISIGASVFLAQASPAQLLQRLQERREAMQVKEQQNQNQGQPASAAPQAQSNSSDVSMVTLQVQHGASGQQMVVTPKGMVVPLPGPGVSGKVVHIYIGAGGGYWYVDRNNKQVDLTAAVQTLQSGPAPQQMASVPQYAPPPQGYAQTASGAGAVTTAAAAGLGAMAGSAMASTWDTVPYGAPIRYGVGAVPYYNHNGSPVYINASTNTAAYANVNSTHVAAINEQQNWYAQQQVAKGANWRTWQQPTANPFVNTAYHQPDAAYGAAAAHYGVEQGQQDARYGAAAGATAAHYGAEQGQQDARRGAAAGATAAHYGSEQGQEEARRGAAAGATAARNGGFNGDERRAGRTAGRRR